MASSTDAQYTKIATAIFEHGRHAKAIERVSATLWLVPVICIAWTSGMALGLGSPNGVYERYLEDRGICVHILKSPNHKPLISSTGTTICPNTFAFPKSMTSLSNCKSNAAVYGLLAFMDRSIPVSTCTDSACLRPSMRSGSDDACTKTRAARYRQ